MFGFIIIILGILFLLVNLNIITEGVWDIFWPLLLIVLGVGLIIKKKRSRCWVCGWQGHETDAHFHEHGNSDK